MARRLVTQIADAENDPELVARISEFYDGPLGFVMAVFPWGKEGTSLHDETGPDEWHIELLTDLGERIKAGERNPTGALLTAVASGHGVGKAQPVSMEIDTPVGKRRWGDLKPGDVVFGRDGRPTKIVSVHPQGVKPVHRVVLDDRTSTLVCAEHLWTVRGRASRRDGSNAWETLSTADLMRRGVTRSNGPNRARQWELPSIEPVEYPAEWVPVDPYTLGVWLGDGARNTDTFTSADPEVPAGVRAAGYEVVESQAKSGKASVYAVRGLRVGLRMLGVYDKGAHEKRVPRRYMENSPAVRGAVLRGLIDTDGFVTPTGAVIFTSVSEGLARDVAWIARSLGGKAVEHAPHPTSYRRVDGSKVEGRPAFNVTLTMPEGFCVALIRRKAERVRATTQKRYLSRWIDRIEDAGAEECMCITVEAADHLYLTNDFIPTHNTTLVAWLILWFISTRQHPQIVVTANTTNQLTGKTWRELSKWHRLMAHATWFTWSATKFAMKAAPDTWFAAAVPWSKERSEAFAGTHEKHVLLIFDEASAVDDAIWESAEGALTTAGAMWFAFGNPTRNTGRFRECWRRFRNRWVVKQVDSRKAKKADQRQIANWIEDYGEDSDFVRIRVKGEFPRSGSTQFIAEDVVEAAMQRFRRAERDKVARLGEPVDGFAVKLGVQDAADPRAPLIMAVDVARFGDDATVVGLRRGNVFIKHAEWRGLDGEQVGQRCAEIINALGPDAVFLDSNGLGASAYDTLVRLGYDVVGVNAGVKAQDESRYFNRRVEMWDLMKLWLGKGGMIQDDPKFKDDLIGPEYAFDAKSRWQLESKDDMKSRGLPSPDTADALAMTFYAPVAPRSEAKAVQALLARARTSGASWMAC